MTQVSCYTCGNEVPGGSMHTIYVNPYSGAESKEPKLVCHQCYMLTLIADLLKEIKDDNTRRPRLQVPNGDVH